MSYKLVSLTENVKIKRKINGLYASLNNSEAFKKANLIIDFTVPKCTLEILKIAAKQKKRVVVGNINTLRDYSWIEDIVKGVYYSRRT